MIERLVHISVLLLALRDYARNAWIFVPSSSLVIILRLGGVPDLGGVDDLSPLSVRRGESARACSILAASPARVIRGGVDDERVLRTGVVDPPTGDAATIETF